MPEAEVSALLQRFATRNQDDYESQTTGHVLTYFAIDQKTHKIIQTTRKDYADGVLVIGYREKLLKEIEKVNSTQAYELHQPPEEHIFPELYLGNKHDQWKMYQSMATMEPKMLGEFIASNPFNDNMHIYFMKLVQLIRTIRMNAKTTNTVEDILRFPDPIKKRYGYSFKAGFNVNGPVLFRCDRLQLLMEDDVPSINNWEHKEFIHDAWVGFNVSVKQVASFRKVYGLFEDNMHNAMYLSEDVREVSVENWLDKNMESIYVNELTNMFYFLMKELVWVAVHCGFVGFTNIAVLQLTQKRNFDTWDEPKGIDLQNVFRVIGYERTKPTPPSFPEILNEVSHTILNLYSRVDFMTAQLPNNFKVHLLEYLKSFDEMKVRGYSKPISSEPFIIPMVELVNVPEFPTTRYFEVFSEIDNTAPYDKSDVLDLFINESKSIIEALQMRSKRIKDSNYELQELYLYLLLLEKAFVLRARCIKFNLPAWTEKLNGVFHDTFLETDLYKYLVKEKKLRTTDTALLEFVKESHE